METFKCPVCGKPGIPDYTHEEVICPNCNSNLGIYRTLHSIAEDNDVSTGAASKLKKLSIALSIALLAGLLCGVSAFLLFQENSRKNLMEVQNKVSELRDSISTLSLQIPSSPTKSEEQHYIEYTILSNDSPWKIVYKFYGTRNDWERISKEIANNNDLWDEKSNTWKPIHPGQVIKIHNIK